MQTIQNISFIGSGNVAFHLAQALYSKGIKINEVFSRSLRNAKDLAKLVNAKAIDDLEMLNSSVDLYIVCVPDDKIKKVIKQLPNSVPVVHTSGSVNLDVFKGRKSKNGIFYPLQTFSKERKLDLSNVPFLLESEDDKFEKEIELLAKNISESTKKINSKKRANIHLAAVFASNFTNELLAISKDILSNENLELYLLLPLIQETIGKAMVDDPRDFQTGPAVRGDIDTIKRHLDSLSDSEERKIYSLLSERIKKMKK